MATIKDVAKISGVSASTVSRALSGNIPVDRETKEKVLKAVKDLNYRPNILAKGLKEGRTNTIGLIIPNIRNPIFPAVARGVEDVARKNGYTVILCNTDEDLAVEKDYVDKLQKRWVDGLIFATATKKSEHILELKAQNFPVMLLVRRMDEKVDAVVVNNSKGAYRATSTLIEKGCKRIALISGNPEVDLYKERKEGYLKALQDHGINMEGCPVVEGINDHKGGYQAMQSILSKIENIDGVFAASDRKAAGAMRAVRDAGLNVPGDIKVIGFDGLDISEMTDPTLSTMTQPTYEMGALAMERLIKIIKSKKNVKPRIDVLEVELTVRKST